MTTFFHKIVDFLLGTKSELIIEKKEIKQEEIKLSYRFLIDWFLDNRHWMDVVEIDIKDVDLLTNDGIFDFAIGYLTEKYNIARHRNINITAWTNLDTLDVYEKRKTIDDEHGGIQEENIRRQKTKKSVRRMRSSSKRSSM